MPKPCAGWPRRARPSLIVTVDCGISAINEAELARELGVELIITDHHTIGPELPAADVIVHPRLPGSAYPSGDLCGAGVAFKLAWQVCKSFGDGKRASPHLRNFLVGSLGLVALATIADVVPLSDENRIIVRHGLAGIFSGPSVGLRALMEVSGSLDKKRLTAGMVGFGLAPRINAAGRLERAMMAVEMLTTDDAEQARVDRVDARFLQHAPAGGRASDPGRSPRDARGRRRPGRSAVDRAGARGLARRRHRHRRQPPGRDVSSPGDRHLAGPGSIARDQPARSRASTSTRRSRSAPTACSPSAATRRRPGSSSEETSSPISRAASRKAVASRSRQEQLEREIMIDAEVLLGTLTLGVVEEIEKLEPHGIGNPRPLLLASDLEIAGQPREVGSQKQHLQLRFKQGGHELKAIGWNLAEKGQSLAAGSRCSVVFHPSINEWNNRRDVQLEIRDIAPAEA